MTINLDEIKARCEAATPGPWNWDSEYYIHDPNPVYVASIRQQWINGVYPLICEVRYPYQATSAANIKFIAHAREDIPALVAEVERLTAQLAEAKAGLAEYANPKSWTKDEDLRDFNEEELDIWSYCEPGYERARATLAKLDGAS